MNEKVIECGKETREIVVEMGVNESIKAGKVDIGYNCPVGLSFLIYDEASFD